ncbi:TPA: hypothetical protein ACH3X2_008568 [Trebouxia sp. C0005]
MSVPTPVPSVEEAASQPSHLLTSEPTDIAWQTPVVFAYPLSPAKRRSAAPRNGCLKLIPQNTSTAMATTGDLLASSTGRCFPESLQLPALGTPELQALRDDLARKIEEGSSRRGATEKTTGASADLKLTTNRAVTYASSGSARTDLFFKYKGSDPLAISSSDQINQLLQQAWQEDPLDTLKLIAHLRDVRDGKGEQKLFHDCVAWMREQHPLTLIANLREVVEVGYWKDLLEMAVSMCVSPAELKERAQQALDRKLEVATKKYEATRKKNKQKPRASEAWMDIPELKQMRKKSFRKYLRSLKTEEEKEAAKAERAKQTAKKHQLISDFVASRKKKKKAGNAGNAIKKITEDDVFRLLHLTVAVLFSEQIQKDLASLKAGKPSDVSLAAKWAPTPGRSHDKDTLMAASIAELLFPARQHQAEGEPYQAYVARIKSLYHKQVLVPLRKCLDVPEVCMSANAWNEVKYARVASVCMRNNKGHFEKHDQERFTKYLQDVKAGKKKIASGALKPHQLVSEAMRHTGLLEVQDFLEADEVEEYTNRSTSLGLETMELQWTSYVNNLKASGCLSNALAVCDVSGSMSGQPMEVAIALSMLVAEVTAPPFNETVCTFSAQPQLHTIKGETLVQKVNELQRMDWGMNTDLNAVFTLILQRALASNILPEQMIETLFVFSDMQFDEATAGGNAYGVYPAPGAVVGHGAGHGMQHTAKETNFKVAQVQFEEHGYKLPKVVFWNLDGDAGDTAVPVTHREEGTALVSGFSGQLLKLFMAGASALDKFNPFVIMKEAISAEKYNGWKVVD